MAVPREVWEEVGLRIELLGEPAVVVDAEPQRVDLVYRARPIDEADADAGEPAPPRSSRRAGSRPSETPELQHETAGALVALARSSRGTSVAAAAVARRGAQVEATTPAMRST